MSGYIFAFPLATMLVLWIFMLIFQNPGRVCPLCGGREEHGRNCPYREDK